MAGPFRSTDFEHAVQLEATFGVSPGALAGADFFRCRTRFPFTRQNTRSDRSQDSDNSASVTTTQKGREKSGWQIEGDAVPSGVTGTPTEPDMDALFEAHFGQKHKATAHTTTAAGSTATVVNFATGGVAASGTQAGDLIAIDVSATSGVEVRQVVSIATDAVTVDRALSEAPATGRNVYVGTTYRFLKTVLNTVHLWGYLSGNNFRQKAGGCVPRNLAVNSDWSGEAPITDVTFSGEGKQVEPHITTKPTPTTAGEPHAPTEAKVWIGVTKHCAVKANLTSDNGIELRTNESCSLFPTGVKRTGNDGRYMVQAAIDLLLQTGTIEGYHDVADDLVAYDVLAQLGVAVGKMVAWRVRKFIPDTPVGDQDGEVSLQLQGRCYASATGDDELALAFI